MKTASAKNKGRRLQNYIVDKLKEYIRQKKEYEINIYENKKKEIFNILNEYLSEDKLKLELLVKKIIQVFYEDNYLEKINLLNENDIRPAIMGENGEDIKMSNIINDYLPFSIEAKNQEKLNIWSAIEQSEKNSKKDNIPVVIFKRNRSKVYITMEFEKFLNLFKHIF